MSFNV